MKLFVESDETGVSTLKKTWQDSPRLGARPFVQVVLVKKTLLASQSGRLWLVLWLSLAVG